MASNTISILLSAKDEASKVFRQVSAELASATAGAGRTSSAFSVLTSSANSLDRQQTETTAGTSRFSESLARVRDVALGVYLPQLASQLWNIGKSAVQGAGDFEQSRVAFETMLGSASKARDLLSQISTFARETPFELPEVVQGSKQLLAFGFSAEEVIPTMRKLGDIASGVGVPVGQLTNVFGQVRTAGKLMGQDLLQFTEAGVPLLDYLAQTMHKSTAQIKADMDKGAGPSFQQVQAAIDAMTSSGSKFGGMMDKQSHTFEGTVSNIKDGFGQILRSAVGVTNAGDIVKGGLFDKLKAGATDVMPLMQRLGDEAGPFVVKALSATEAEAQRLWQKLDQFLGPSLSALWSTVTTKVVPTLQELWHQVIEPLIPVVGTLLVGAIWGVTNGFNIALQSIAWVVKALTDGNPFVWAFVGALGALVTALAIQNGVAAFQSAMDIIAAKFTTMSALVSTPLVMPAIAVGAAVAALVEVYDQAQKTLAAVDAATASKTALGDARLDAQKQLENLRANGTPEQKARAIAKGRQLGLPGFASGTSFAPGGLSWVGEEGPELVDLPRGSKVYPAQQSQQMAAAGRSVSIGQIIFQSNSPIDMTARLQELGWMLKHA